MVIAGPLPQVGQLAEVMLHGIAITCLPGKYEVTEADRFGQKISTGDLRYDDFNPFESAETLGNITGGAGLRRMSDKPITVAAVPLMYKETSGVNASGYPTILSPQQNLETLPGVTAPAIWVGEFTPSTGALAGVTQLVAVAGQKIFRRSAGSWVDTGVALAGVAIKGAVGAFLGTLIIGYGGTNTAQATTDLAVLGNVQQTAGPTNIYIWAITTDRAASYVAGGTAVTNYNQVMSSAAAASGYASAIATGNGIITSLAPGGGIAIVFVGKTTELGEIDTNGVYRTLIPFDSALSTNCNPLKWWLSSGENQQRGPTILVFPRERGLWVYQPATTNSGSAFNISPWADPVIRPPNARGIITAFQGTARWLYFTTYSNVGRTFVWRKDAATGDNHTYLDLGTNACQALCVTALFGQPLLFAGTGNNLTSVILPIDGDNEADDPACRFAASGTLDYADIDLGFPDEDKIGFYVRVIADDLVAGAQTIDVQVAKDNGAYLDLGLVSQSPGQSVYFATYTAAKRLSPRVVYATNDPTKTPKGLAVSFRLSLNTTLYKLWTFTGTLSTGGTLGIGTDDLRNPQADIDALWADRAAGVPISFVDRWNQTYTVRLLSFKEQQILRQPDKTPETAVTCTLLYVSTGPGSFVYDAAIALYDQPTSVYA